MEKKIFLKTVSFEPSQNKKNDWLGCVIYQVLKQKLDQTSTGMRTIYTIK